MKGYTMKIYEDDLSIAMREIEETKEAMIQTEITPELLTLFNNSWSNS